MEDDFLRGVADTTTGIAGLGVHADMAHLLFHRIGGGIHIHMTVAGEMF